MHVINNFAGTWTGDARITGCDASGDFAVLRFCDTSTPNTILPVTLTLSQNRDTVAGSLVPGSIAGRVAGAVDNYGQYIANGTATSPGDNVVLTYAIGGLVGQANGPESIAWWAMTVIAPGRQGNGYLKINSSVLHRIADDRQRRPVGNVTPL